MEASERIIEEIKKLPVIERQRIAGALAVPSDLSATEREIAIRELQELAGSIDVGQVYFEILSREEMYLTPKF